MEGNMVTDVAIEWTGIAYMMCTFLYIVFLYLLDNLEKTYYLRRPISDEEALTRLAKKMNCSEYELFKLSTKDWSISTSRIENDFNEYLTDGIMPYYVRSFIRKHKHLLKNRNGEFQNGGSLPSSWVA